MHPLAEGQQEVLDKFLDEHLAKDTLDDPIVHMLPHSSLLKRKMESLDQFKIIAHSTTGQSETHTHYHSSKN